MHWQPISLRALEERICLEEKSLRKDASSLWNKIRIKPEKWVKEPEGTQGGGFWVVGVSGSTCLYYNDIEDGFDWSKFSQYGKIEEYGANQDSLCLAIDRVLEEI